MAAAAPPTEPIDDVTAEILLRLPPDEPEHLFRAALVCKPWLRVLCDPSFLRRYRAYHGAPPLLGFIHMLQLVASGGDSVPRFSSTTAVPAFPHPVSSSVRHTRAFDCRHGRVVLLLEGASVDFLVWNPVTGDRRGVPLRDVLCRRRVIRSAAVVCAADGCDHLDCHDGPFHVVLVGSDAT
ncbi:unnamed protein product [Urochloa humidicola]